MTIILGGMVFDGRLGKGVKQKLREPNPQKVELPRKSNLTDVFNKAKELFSDKESSITNMYLGDSCGLIVNVEKSKWVLDSYYKRCIIKMLFELIDGKFYSDLNQVSNDRE
jgi:hypothetical protein